MQINNTDHSSLEGGPQVPGQPGPQLGSGFRQTGTAPWWQRWTGSPSRLPRSGRAGGWAHTPKPRVGGLCPLRGHQALRGCRTAEPAGLASPSAASSDSGLTGCACQKHPDASSSALGSRSTPSSMPSSDPLPSAAACENEAPSAPRWWRRPPCDKPVGVASACHGRLHQLSCGLSDGQCHRIPELEGTLPLPGHPTAQPARGWTSFPRAPLAGRLPSLALGGFTPPEVVAASLPPDLGGTSLLRGKRTLGARGRLRVEVCEDQGPLCVPYLRPGPPLWTLSCSKEAKVTSPGRPSGTTGQDAHGGPATAQGRLHPSWSPVTQVGLVGLVLPQMSHSRVPGEGSPRHPCRPEV